MEGNGNVLNNSIIQTAAGHIRSLHCLSATQMANVGQLIAPNGNDITNDSSIVTIGDIMDPGVVSLHLSTFTRSNPGVYTCIIPDEHGTNQFLHVGIYHRKLDGDYLELHAYTSLLVLSFQPCLKSVPFSL